MQPHSTLIVIPARLASSRLPHKPLADIHGKPMIVHVWERAVAARAGQVIVACDSEAVKTAIEKAGGKAIMTREDHASGSDRVWEAYRHFDSEGKYHTIVNVQGDLPTLEPHLIPAVLQPLEDPMVDIATLACPIDSLKDEQDVNIVKPVIAFRTGQIGRALYFTRCTAPYGDGVRYHHIGIYAYRRDSLRRFVELPPSPLELREKLEQLRALEQGMRIDVSIVKTVPLGVDTAEHLERARELLHE